MPEDQSSSQPQLNQLLDTEITRIFKIRHPVVLAGMNVAGAKLAAAVSNYGGLGVIGGVHYTPKMLRKEIAELKSLLHDPNLPYGVDLLIPQIGGNARKTNKDYSGGNIAELIDIIIEEKATLFVCAVGVCPKWIVDKFHASGILVQNMCGHPKHCLKALETGVDILCVQGTEGGGHTGAISTIVLIPQVVELVKGKISPLTGRQVPVIAAGGIYDGRGLAASLSLGAEAVWVGTRFVACHESSAGPRHMKAIVEAQSDQTIRTTIYTGRPLRALRDKFNVEWEEERRVEMHKLQSQGIVPAEKAMSQDITLLPLLMGEAAGAIKEVQSAAAILNEMVSSAATVISQTSTTLVKGAAKL